MKSVITTLLGGTLLVVSLSAAAAQLSPEDQIETRKAGFTYMAWNMGKIKAQVGLSAANRLPPAHCSVLR